MRTSSVFFMALSSGLLLTACSTDRDYWASDPGTVFKTPAGAERRARQDLNEAKSVLTDNERRQIDEAAGAERPNP